MTQAGNAKNIAAGLLFMAIGAGYAANAWLRLPIGTVQEMGPGYFPLMLAGAMGLIGALIAGRALRQEPSPLGPVSWRAMILVTVAPVVFALTLDGLGFVPATALATGLAAFASRRTKPAHIAALTVCVTALCSAVFLYGFKLPAAAFGPWLGL